MLTSHKKISLKTLFNFEESGQFLYNQPDEITKRLRIQEKLIRLKQVLSILEKDALQSQFAPFNKKHECEDTNNVFSQNSSSKLIKYPPRLNLQQMKNNKLTANPVSKAQNQFYLKHIRPHETSQTDESYSGVSFHQYNRRKYMQSESSLPKSSSENEFISD